MMKERITKKNIYIFNEMNLRWKMKNDEKSNSKHIMIVLRKFSWQKFSRLFFKKYEETKKMIMKMKEKKNNELSKMNF